MDTNTVQQVGEMIDTLGQKLSPAIELAAKKMGVAAEYVFTLFVKQAFVEAIIYLTATIVLLVLCSISWRFLWKVAWPQFKNNEHNDSFQFILGFSFVASLISSIATLMTFFVNINTIISGFVNPQYMAIQNLITLVK